MNASWKCEKDHLVCGWSGVGERVPYNPPWMQTVANDSPRGSAPKFMDFTRLSPFGGRRWYDPNRGYESQAAPLASTASPNSSMNL